MLSPSEYVGIDAICARIEGARRGYVPHTPHPRQAEFLALDTREALYGGAAGGGKSDALLMAALEYVHVPSYAAILFRRTYADLALPGAIMDRAKEWLEGTDATWNDRDKRWTFPSGATLSFGYLDTDKDRFRYQSAEFQFIGFDELTQFPEGWYRYLFSRLRRLHGVSVPLRMRGATNPGGIGHEWVRRRFVAEPTLERPFIPARLADNPSLDADAYRLSLVELDTTTRAQLLEGVWVRDAEGLVYRFSEERNAIPKAPELQKFVLGIDYGARSPTAFVVMGWRVGDPTVYVLRAWKEPGLSPSAAAGRVKELGQSFKFAKIIGDTGGLGAGYAEEARDRFKLPIEPAEKQNKLGYIKLLNGDLERGRVKVVAAECAQLTTEWLELPWHEDQDREASGFDNHCADAMLYGWRAAWAHFAPDLEPAAPLPTDYEAKERKRKYLDGLRREREKRERFQGRVPVTHDRRALRSR